ncbi:hypothetical protein KJI95_06990 [Shewanella sp. JM162201]|uniref:Inner membrane protein YbhQ n=1 Tax=Shewanella jiangmenensis TaxID=2837387 RepID=A0ABS5V1H6_9GAMM|nr:hypothetical protein [Shewanella jiangmenensis]MBT1444270.1 hypothetical protein [Shewanella jiangmenensis]
MADKQLSEPSFWFQRLSKTTLRALHLLGICGVGGGVLLGVAKGEWQHYWLLAMLSGSMLMGWEIWRDWRWLIQLKGVLTLVKLALLALFIPLPEYKAALFISILLLSVLVSHGPAGLRHYSIWHRRQLHSRKEIKG